MYASLSPSIINVTVHISIFLSAWFSICIVYISVHLSIDICRLSACLPVCLSLSVSLLSYLAALSYLLLPILAYPILPYLTLSCLLAPINLFNLSKSTQVIQSLSKSIIMCMCTSLSWLIYFFHFAISITHRRVNWMQSCVKKLSKGNEDSKGSQGNAMDWTGLICSSSCLDPARPGPAKPLEVLLPQNSRNSSSLPKWSAATLWRRCVLHLTFVTLDLGVIYVISCSWCCDVKIDENWTILNSI